MAFPLGYVFGDGGVVWILTSNCVEVVDCHIFLDNVWIAIYLVCSWQMRDGVVRFVVMSHSNHLLLIVVSVVRLLPSFI
jgi:hypothetical protein